MAKGLGRSQEAYDRFSSAVDAPLTIAAVLWLPFLIIPLFVRLKCGVAATRKVVVEMMPGEVLLLEKYARR